MENGKEARNGSYYAVAIPSEGRYFIIFPDFNHLLPQVPTLDKCPAAARQLLQSILLRRLMDGETLPVPSSRDEASQNTLNYIQRVKFPLDGNAPIFPVTFDREALDAVATRITLFQESSPGEEIPTTPEAWDYLTQEND